MTSARMRRRLALLALVLISALAIGITSTQATDPSVGIAPLAADGTPAVVQIGDESMSAADFKENVAVVHSNVNYMQGQIAAGSQDSAYYQAYVDLINAHGVENVAFAGMIENQALYEMAVTRGYRPNDDMVQAKVAQDKALAAQSIDPAAAAYIASVGEERFWTTLYPDTVRHELATQALFQNVISGKASTAEQIAAWTEVEQQALATTHITILDASAIAPASKNDAINYLHDYWQFSAQ